MSTDGCDLNCASCMEECENRTLILEDEPAETYQKGICVTGKFPQAKCFETVSSGKNGWDHQEGHLLDEIVEDLAIRAALDFASRVFMICEAKDQTEAGITAFCRALKDPEYTDQLRVYAACEKGQCVGMGATRSSGTQLALCYVDPEKQRQGIGRALFERMLRDDPAEVFQVHAAPSAVGFYEKCGFVRDGDMTEEDGIRYTPMTFIRKRI